MPSKTKVLYVLSMLGSGGTEAFVVNVVRSLPQDKFDVTIALALDENSDEALQTRKGEAIDMGAHIEYLGAMKLSVSGIIRFIQNIHKVIEKCGPFDVVHGNMDLFNGIIMFATSKSVPIRIAHAHNSQSQSMTAANTAKFLAFLVYKFLMRRLILKYATYLCGCSEKALHYEFGENYKLPSSIIYNGMPLNVFSAVQQDDSYIKSAFSLLKRNNYILTAGRVSNQKNPWFIIKAIYELSRIRNDFVFIWAGINPYLESFQSKAEELGIREHIVFAGARNDLPQLMRNSDLFILPSSFEGFGMVLTEAQATGLYCLASDKVPTLTDCGLCEYLDIDAFDAPALWAKRISFLLDNKPEGKPNEKIKLFDINNTIDQLKKIYSGE